MAASPPGTQLRRIAREIRHSTDATAGTAGTGDAGKAVGPGLALARTGTCHHCPQGSLIGAELARNTAVE